MSAEKTPGTTPSLTTDELRLLAGHEREGLAKTREEPQEPQAGSRAGGSG